MVPLVVGSVWLLRILLKGTTFAERATVCLAFAVLCLGAGWAALDRSIPYSTTRIQAGGPLSTKQGYPHKLIVPHAVRLVASPP